MSDNILGLKIKQLRSEYSMRIGEKFTQAGLAKEIGISRSYLSDIESGRTKPNDELLNKIANFFNIDIECLYELNEETNNIIKNRKQSLIDNFLDELVEEGIITNLDDIDEDTEKAIINAVKAQLEIKLKKNKKRED